MTRRILVLSFLLALFSTGPLQADVSDSPTLTRIAESGVFRVGFVPDAPPMSFINADGKTTGYSVELCRHIFAAVKRTLGREDLDIRFVPLVAPSERIAAITNGDVDIECGATTVTLTRREKVDFTLMTYITGGTVLSRGDKPLQSLENLPGKRIAVIAGTTTEDALTRFGELNEFRFRLVLIRTHVEGMQMLTDGKVDGYASDRAMLVGQVFRSKDAAKYQLARSVFSREPYSLMLQRGDTEFRLVADRALASLYRDARIRRLHHDWFGRYGEALSPVVEAMYEFQAVSE